MGMTFWPGASLISRGSLASFPVAGQYIANLNQPPGIISNQFNPPLESTGGILFLADTWGNWFAGVRSLRATGCFQPVGAPLCCTLVWSWPTHPQHASAFLWPRIYSARSMAIMLPFCAPAAPGCRSVAQSGSAPRSGRGGRRFESSHSDQYLILKPLIFLVKVRGFCFSGGRVSKKCRKILAQPLNGTIPAWIAIFPAFSATAALCHSNLLAS